jgi:hypothetical protein
MAVGTRRAGVLLWCAGAVEVELLRDLPTERTRYTSLGLSLFVPAIAGFAGMYSAIYSIHENWLIALAGGCIWSLIVFIIDRALVASFRRAPSPPGFSFLRLVRSASEHLALFVVRGLVALLVGAIISHALVLLIFRPETDERLAREREVRLAEVGTPFETTLNALRESDAAELQRLQDARARRDHTAEERNKETAGVGLSGKYGRGPAREDLNSTLIELDGEIGTLDTAYRAHHAETVKDMDRVSKERERAKTGAAEDQAHGYMARARALSAIAAASPELRQDRQVLFGFFLMLELVPLVVKTLLLSGPYAKRVALNEWLAEESSRIEYAAVESAREERIGIRRIKILDDAFDNAGFGTRGSDSNPAAGVPLT